MMILAFRPILRTLVSQDIIYKIEHIPECGFHNASEDLGKIIRIIKPLFSSCESLDFLKQTTPRPVSRGETPPVQGSVPPPRYKLVSNPFELVRHIYIYI